MTESKYRYFTSYVGMKLPLTLVTPLADGDIRNRNTFIRAQFDERDRLVLCEKMVYGEIEMSHRYRYYPGGGLAQADIITADGDEDEVTVLRFNEAGAPLA